MKQKILLNGIIAGIAVVGYVLLFYYMDRTSAFSPVIRFSSWLICSFFMFLTIKDIKNADFKVLLRGAFAVFLIANAIYYVYDFVLYNYVDKTLVDIEKNAAIEWLLPSTPITEQYDLKQRILNYDGHNFSSNIYQWARWSIIFGFGLSLLVSYLVKRRGSDK